MWRCYGKYIVHAYIYIWCKIKITSTYPRDSELRTQLRVVNNIDWPPYAILLSQSQAFLQINLEYYTNKTL